MPSSLSFRHPEGASRVWVAEGEAIEGQLDHIMMQLRFMPVPWAAAHVMLLPYYEELHHVDNAWGDAVIWE